MKSMRPRVEKKISIGILRFMLGEINYIYIYVLSSSADTIIFKNNYDRAGGQKFYIEK